MMTTPQITTKARYLTASETAKLVRAALKRSFASIKFSVRSKTYSGGASIDVSWTDGPTGSQVSEIIKQFEGGRFDGMVDYAYSVDHWLAPDGTATLAHSHGSACTGGLDPEKFGSQHQAGSELVRFGADYIFAHRDVSDATLAPFVAKYLDRMGVTDPNEFVKAENVSAMTDLEWEAISRTASGNVVTAMRCADYEARHTAFVA